MKPFSDMTKSELEPILAKLRSDLKEIEEEKAFVLGQTGLHVTGSTSRDYREEVELLRNRVKEVEIVLAAKTD